MLKNRRKLVKYMKEIICARTRNYQEKRKSLVVTYVIMNYRILKMMRREALVKLSKSWEHKGPTSLSRTSSFRNRHR